MPESPGDMLPLEPESLPGLNKNPEDAAPAESQEVRFSIQAEDFRAVGEKVLADFTEFVKEHQSWKIVEPNYEGVRVAFDDEEVKGWMLVRMSLHDPVLPMNVEAEKEGGADVILGRLDPFFARYPELKK